MIITKEPIDIWNHSRQVENMTLFHKSTVCQNVMDKLIDLGIATWFHTGKLSLYFNSTRDNIYLGMENKSTEATTLDSKSYEVESILEESSITDDAGYQHKNSIGHFRILQKNTRIV